ncbi:MAG: diguanylate cyclase [Gammaproteobacteria bacterium]|nr:diguanylate cyclase [Gammaproteobacteria bacterium]
MNAEPKKTRLLLVEDNPGDIRLIEELLSDFEFELSIECTLSDTLSRLGNESVDAVLLDLNLPDSTGLNTVRALVSAFPLTPVIILTALDSEEHGLTAIKAGAQDYIPKSEMSRSVLKRALRYGQQRMALQHNFRKLLEHNLDPTFVVSQEGDLYYENQTARRVLGDDYLRHFTNTFFRRYDINSPSHVEIEIKQPDQEPRIFSMHTSPVNWGNEDNTCVVSLHDMTETRRVQEYLEESNKALQTLVTANADTLRLSTKILETMAEAVIVTDAGKRITAVNPAFTRMTGYDVSEVLGNTLEMLHSGLQGAHFYDVMLQELEAHGYYEGEVWHQHKDGHVYCVQESVNPIFNHHDDEVSHYISILRDVTSRVEREKHILNQALHDSLTGLANRILLNEGLQQNILLAARKGYKLGILFIDIDNFKLINDALGHALGDSLLCEIASRMRSCARACDLVARLGGDEFVIVLTDVTGIESVESAAGHIIAELSQPYMLNDTRVDISISIGISLWPDHGAEIDELLNRADLAMYEVKRNGKGDWRLANNG